jgi:hypothetical protein
VITVANNIGATDATSMSLVNGFVAFTNSQGNTTISEYTPSNFASGGIPSNVSGVGGAAISMTLSTYQTPGLASKLAEAKTIDATGSSSAQIDEFITNHNHAAGNSLINADLNVNQFTSLTTGTDMIGLFSQGVNSLNALGATGPQIANILIRGSVASNNNMFQTGAIYNLTLDTTNLHDVATNANLPSRIATNGIEVNAIGTLAGADTTQLMNDVVTLTSQVSAVTNVSFDSVNIAAGNLAQFLANLAFQGITSTDATNFSEANWTTLVANKTAFAAGSITNAGTGAQNLSVAQFLSIPNKFATNGVTYLSLASATDAQIDSLSTFGNKIADHALYAADLTPAQFASLALKIHAGEATVDAATATAAQVTTILQNLTAFNDSLSNLSLTADQFNSLLVAGKAQLDTAIVTATTSITASTATIIDASAMTKALNVTGSDGADNITMGDAANTVQGGMGKDYITAAGSLIGQELRGGNAADTIIGGDGADTIYGGKSLVAQLLTGNGGADVFHLSAASVNQITDLADADTIDNAAGAVTTARIVNGGSYTAATTDINGGSLTILAEADDSGTVINASLMTATAGVTINGGTGADALTGTALGDLISTGANAVTKVDTVHGGDGNDTITGASGLGTAILYGDAGNDSITGGTSVETIDGGAGANTLTGGSGNDTFVVTGTDTVTDLHGGDIVQIALGATVNATVTADWAAGATSANDGTATITVGNGFDVDLSADAGTIGYAVTAAGNATASIIIGTDNGDTITGGLGADSIAGGLGADALTGGAGADMYAQFAGDSVVRTAETFNTLTISDGNTITFGDGVDVITGFVSGTDKIDTTTASSVSYLNGATTATALTAGENYYVRGDWNATTKIFTVNATGADSMVVADAVNAAVDANTQDGIVILTGVTGLTAADFV